MAQIGPMNPPRILSTVNVAKLRLGKWAASAAVALAVCGCSTSDSAGLQVDGLPGGGGNPTPTGSVPGSPSPGPVQHWSFTAPVKPTVPTWPAGSPEAAWVANPIDAFVLARLHAAGRAPAAPASPEKLLRRVTLDLTGLPPTLEQLDAFVADPSEDAYAAVVEHLLASKAYAERMASAWLDLARYSDTDGYQYDIPRPAWPWRDWVLDAFDTNMPWDRFTIEQIAGDLLPDASANTRIATGFNRNHAIQGENGLLLDEFRDQYVSDRLDVLGKTWLGLTLGCAKCHDHKFEPLTARDYYQLYDCFNSIDEGDNGPASKFSPTLDAESPLAQSLLVEIDARIAELTAAGAGEAELARLNAQRSEVMALIPQRVMRDLAPLRETRVLAVGRYDAPIGEPLHCSPPSFLPPFPSGAPANRLGLALWLTMPENPLTARVTVNRVWQMHFGRGLSPMLDNLGVEAAAPDHGQLLDWLAVDFVANGWDMKALHRTIVTSNTYRQSSATTGDELTLDPDNTLLGRGPRFALPAEVVRDLPLAVSGLLVHRFGGPPEYPYQPAGLWEELSWEGSFQSYPRYAGDSLYRRSLYTVWKRTLPPPFMTIFDASDRDHATAGREVSITPQQVLALLNGPQFVEAARHVAARVTATVGAEQPGATDDIEETNATDTSNASDTSDTSAADAGSGEDTVAASVDSRTKAAIVLAFRQVVGRSAEEEEMRQLAALYHEQLTALTLTPEVAAKIQSTGDSAASTPTPEAAALTQVVRVLFGLVETTTLE